MSKSSSPIERVRAAAQLAEHAREIRRLGQRAIEGIIEIGQRLIDAKRLAGHGNWLPWLDREFGWDERTARRFMSVAEKSDKLSDLDVPVSALYLLARPSTPDEVIEEVAARSREGGKITYKDVVDMTTAREIRVVTTYTDHPVVAPHYEPAPPGEVIPPDQPSPIEQRATQGDEEASKPEATNVIHVLYGNVATVADQEFEHRVKRMAARAAKHAWFRANRHAIAVMGIKELQVDFKGENAWEDASRLAAGGPFSPFEAVIKLLPLLTDEECAKLATIIHERSTDHQ